ncbi:MAG: helix-turn-helix domain-containing protein [Lachnospiraceae bacterium]|nr:helix-turn-helix domain-containing protein [Lachnospiraceae bacterium]
MTMLTNNIQSIRKSQHYKQQDLADYLGVTRKTVYRLETGDAEPTLSMAWAIAKFLGKNLEDVFRTVEV